MALARMTSCGIDGRSDSHGIHLPELKPNEDSEFGKRDSTVIENSLVFCVCVIRNRLDLLRRSIACFVGQAHPDRELLLAYQSDHFETATFAQTVHSEQILSAVVDCKANPSVGSLRNAGINAARGRYVATWTMTTGTGRSAWPFN